jgi:hypothetical protein
LISVDALGLGLLVVPGEAMADTNTAGRALLALGPFFVSCWIGFALPVVSAADDCAEFAEGSLSRAECEHRLRLRPPKPVPPQAPAAPIKATPAEDAEPAPYTDFDRDSARRICEAYVVTGNEWVDCVDALSAEPPCPTPRLGDATGWWTRCVQDQVREARRRVATEMAAMAERARQAELEERRVRALERSAQAAEDQARAADNLRQRIRRPFPAAAPREDTATVSVTPRPGIISDGGALEPH